MKKESIVIGNIPVVKSRACCLYCRYIIINAYRLNYRNQK